MAKKGGDQRGKRSERPSRSSSSDPRFASLSTDPRFRLPSQKHTKVRLDGRFSRLLKDEDFTKKASVDRYGRRIDSSRGKKELERLYQVASASDTDESDSSESDEADDDAVVKAELRRVAGTYDPAREGGFSTSEDESDGSDVDAESDAEDEVAQEEIPEGEVTARLAVVNMDWDNIKAADLMAVATSFVPSEGKILNVTIYPSEFGREMMQREETEGPARELFQSTKGKGSSASAPQTLPLRGKRAEKDEEDDSSDVEEDDEDDGEDNEEEDEEMSENNFVEEGTAKDYDPKKLRNYQLQRLRYYYAVITASSPDTAKAIYDAMDGREYLTSANFFDLRFVPDDTSFDDDEPHDECTSVPSGYRPREFVTQALRHSNVKLTWDEEDGSRKDVMRRAFERGGELDNDLLAYLGSDSSGESQSDSDDEAEKSGKDVLVGSSRSGKASREKASKASALRAALGLAGDAPPVPEKRSKDKKEATGGMQITFVPGFSAEGEDGNQAVFENAPEETTVEKYIRKERERKARRKEKAKNRGGVDAADDEPEATSRTGGVAEEDLGFDDPFFENPVESAKQAAKRAKKLEREVKATQEREQNIAKEKEKKELELLMADDDGASGVRHFDMNEIMKREKASRKKGKAKKKSEAKYAGVPEDNFELNTKDPRFSALFDSHEYAIDPTNPRYKGTKGMRGLLDEGRQKRASETFEDGKPAKRQKQARESEGEDLQRLVDKVSKRAKK